MQRINKHMITQNKDMKSKFHPDKNGYFGQFGGAFIPELLHPNVQMKLLALDQLDHLPEHKLLELM